MEQIKCSSCGGVVIVPPGAHVGICGNCGSEVPIPDLSPALTAQYSRANDLLSQSEFADAQHAFEQILDTNPTDAAACWGRALSEYGVEYVHDPHTDELLPTFHRLSAHRFSEYVYAKQAVQYAVDPEQKEFYIAQCGLIDTIQQRSLEISNREEPYDIFLCYKRSEADETRTPDSRLAADLYKELTKNGYKVFFAEESLHAGEEYEPHIMAALHTARAMIAIATKVEFYNAVWVKNEWGRYLELIDQEMKAGGSVNGSRMLIPMFQHISHGELPPSLRNMPNYIEMDQVVNPKRDLLQLLSRHFGTSAPAGSAKAEAVRRQVAADRKAQRDSVSMQVSPENYCTRGNISLASSNFEGARVMFQKALDMKPRYAEAYFGLALCDFGIPSEQALAESPVVGLMLNENYRKAVEYASPELEQIYMDYADNAVRRKKEKDHQEEQVQEAKVGLKGMLKALSSHALNLPGYGLFKEEEAWLKSQKQQYQAELRKVGGFEGSLKPSLFLLLGNVAPALLFATGLYDSGHDSLLEVFCLLASLVAYFIPVNHFLSEFMEGCLATIIRLALSILPGFFLAMGMYTLVEMEDKPLVGPITGPHIVYLFAGIMFLIWVYYFFIYAGIKRGHMRRARNIVKESGLRANTLNRVLQAMDSDAKQAIEKHLAPYKAYYDSGSYDAEVRKAAKTATDDNQQRIDALAEQMRTLGN